MGMTGSYASSMRWLRIGAGGLVAVALLLGVPGFSAPAGAEDPAAPIVVIEVGDPIDQRLMDFVADTIASREAHLYVLKINSPGVSSGNLEGLLTMIDGAPAPVVAWIGPFPAVAFGGAAYVVNHADIRSAAPGAVVGYLDPAIQRGDARQPKWVGDGRGSATTEAELAGAVVEVGDDVPVVAGLVERRDPALGQLLLSLDGQKVAKGGTQYLISTAETIEVDGQPVIVQSRPVTFVKPGLIDRFLRLGARPETAFLFLVIGLAFAAFEFYAAGSGLMAFVASLSLILGGYGLATLPVFWPALVALLVGFVLLVWGFILNRVDWRAAVGTALLLASGFLFTTTRPAYPPSVWMVIVAVAASVLFIWYSLTTVVRGRFATPTIGREDMIGRRCLAVERLDPLGVVAIDGARWRATADRGVEIDAGSPVEVVGITGLILEVDPVTAPGRETSS